MHELAERNIRRESEHRRQVSVLEARLVEAGAKSTRRRDLLQLQASLFDGSLKVHLFYDEGGGNAWLKF